MTTWQEDSQQDIYSPLPEARTALDALLAVRDWLHDDMPLDEVIVSLDGLARGEP